MNAQVWVSCFRIAERRHASHEEVRELYKNMLATAACYGPVKYHPEEEFFRFTDGSELVYNHDHEHPRNV